MKARFVTSNILPRNVPDPKHSTGNHADMVVLIKLHLYVFPQNCPFFNLVSILLKVFHHQIYISNHSDTNVYQSIFLSTYQYIIPTVQLSNYPSVYLDIYLYFYLQKKVYMATNLQQKPIGTEPLY